MGPTALFDKSFLQSLSLDESVWFDHFFYPVICPLFYVETLADLEKAIRQGRTPEHEVGVIAQKTPEIHGTPSVHHVRLALENLTGRTIPMNGRIPIAGGRPVKAVGRTGMIFDAFPEAEAFSRWQNGEFLEVERRFARAWRASLSSLDLQSVAASMRSVGIDAKTCRSLEDAKRLARSAVSVKDRSFDRMKLAFLFLNIPREYERPILERWQIAGYQPLCDFAPYTAHVLEVELFFQIALASHLLGTERPSNRVDVAYLSYLPFCMIFVSTDNLHRRCAPLFLRADQAFVWGEDLKADLKRLNDYYAQFPEGERERGITKLAPRPPENDDGLVARLWDHHLRPWRSKSTTSAPRDPVKEKELVDYLTKFRKAPALPPEQVDFESDDIDMLSIQRRVHKQKGSWWQVPKDLKSSEED
jgi:hypothetical protein